MTQLLLGFYKVVEWDGTLSRVTAYELSNGDIKMLYVDPLLSQIVTREYWDCLEKYPVNPNVGR